MTAPWIDRAERRLRFLEIPNLAGFVVAMNALTALLAAFKPEFPEQLLLQPSAIVHGQVWRVLTFILVPPAMGLLLLAIWLFFYFWYLSELETAWGHFKFTLYLLIGALATAAASLAARVPLGSFYFALSLLLAFARLHPDVRLLLPPISMRWAARLTWFALAWSMLFGGFQDRVAIVAGLLNYALFFGPEHWFHLRQAWRRRRFRA